MSEEDRIVKSNKIKSVARLYIARDDYAKVRMIDIAKEVGISNGNLFQYFPTKESLFLALLDDAYIARLDQLEKLVKTTVIKSHQDFCMLVEKDMFQLLQPDSLLLKLLSMRPMLLEREGCSPWYVPLREAEEQKEDTIIDEMLASDLNGLDKQAVKDIFSFQRNLAVSYHALVKVEEALHRSLSEEDMNEKRIEIRQQILNQLRYYLAGFSQAIASGKSGTVSSSESEENIADVLKEKKGKGKKDKKSKEAKDKEEKKKGKKGKKKK
jgi:AcrR family transcriptional regulator